MSDISSPPTEGESITAQVKWFNPTKGFGFLVPDDGSPDVFCHVSAVERAGFDSLPQGATVTCEIVQGQKGPQVSQILDVDTSTATVMPPRGDRPRRPGPGPGPGGFQSRRYDEPTGPTEEVEGTVKFYNVGKSYGFVTPDSGGQGRVHPCQGAGPFQHRRSGASAARAADDHARPARTPGDQRRADLRPLAIGEHFFAGGGGERYEGRRSAGRPG